MIMKLSRVFIWLMIAVLLVFTVGFSVGKELLEDIGDFQSDIERFASEQTGMQVRVGSLRGRWLGMRPELELYSLEVRKEDALPALFTANKIQVQWLIFASFFNLEPRIKLWVDGATLELVFNDGYLLPAGIEPPEPSDTATTKDAAANLRLVDFINRQPYLELTNSEVRVEGLWAKKAVLSNADILMVNRFGYREIDGRFDLSGPSDSSMQMYGRVQGALANLNTLQGQYYLKMDNSQLVPWIPPDLRVFEHLQIEDAAGSVELWARVKRGVVHRVTANVALENLAVQNLKDGKRESLDVAKGTLLYQQFAKGKSQIVLSDFQMEHELFQWTPKLLSLGVERLDNESWSFDLLTDEVEIAPWVQYYVALSDPETTAHRMLFNVSPKGTFEHLNVKAKLQQGVVADIYASGILSDFETTAYEYVPGINYLDVDFELTDTEGFVAISSKTLALNYPAILRDPLAIDWVDGGVQFRRNEKGVLIESGLLAINNDDLRTTTRLSFQLFNDENVSPRIKLQSTLRGLDASLLPLYLPAGVLPDSLTKFLDRSVHSGHIVRGDIVFNGPLDWKHQEEDLNMQLGFMADGTEFGYLPDWEPVVGAQADVLVDRVFVDAYITEGVCYGMTLEQAVVTTRNDDAGLPARLAVQGYLEGAAENGMGVLQKSPLRSVTGDFVDAIDVRGDLGVDLGVSLTLGREEPDISVDVGLSLNDGRFSIPKQNIAVSDIEGELTFDLVNGLRATDLKGKSFGGDLQVVIAPEFENADRRSTKIGLTGDAALAQVDDWLNLPLVGQLEGVLPYTGTITLPVEKLVQPDIALQSSMEGVSVSLPAPFNKESASKRELHVRSTLGGGDVSILSVHYGDLVSFAAEKELSRLTKVAVVFGDEEAVLPNENGYQLNGDLTTFNLKEWVEIVAASEDKLNMVEGATDGDSSVVLRPSLLIEESMLSSQFNVGELDIYGQKFTNTTIASLPSSDSWDIQASGEDVSVRFELPRYLLNSKRALREQITPIVASFATLKITREASLGSDKQTPADSDRELAILDPTVLPPIKLSMENLIVDGEDFGLWELQFAPIQNGMLIQPLSALVRATNFSGTGRWIRNNQNQIKTIIEGKASATDVADILRGWGVEPTLDSKSASASIEASWPGAPFEFDLLNADAIVELHIEDGHFLKVNSGAVDKFWGALNFQTIMKRLQLNFADLNSSDLTFSDIDGDLKLENKVLVVERMVVDSPAVDITLEGDVLLDKEELDMSLDVAIPVTRNLILPAAAVGGLPAAATAYVIEKVLGDQLNKLTTVKYSVTGSFDKPSIQAKDSFNVIPKPVQESILSTGGDEASNANVSAVEQAKESEEGL
ncbi:hypothetical protein A9Q99_03955 [Gammaproteobacteria bacterium 45_16_T64]|nr:hypothetical protein A9Q99_03955 [Gammaproteobacteria bacterium 45_16_T64]